MEKIIVLFPYKNLQLVYPPYDMARLMRNSLYFMKNDGIPMIPGVEPILLDLENLFLPSVSLENLILRGKNEKNRKKKEIAKKSNVANIPKRALPKFRGDRT